MHSKLMIVDDLFLTCGSANLVDLSFEKNHTEVNVAVWSRRAATALREEIFREHLGSDECDGKDPADAFKRFAEISRDNAQRVGRSEPLPCMAHGLDPTHYGIALYGVSIELEARACR